MEHSGTLSRRKFRGVDRPCDAQSRLGRSSLESVRAESELPDSLPESDSIEDVAFARLDAAQLRAALAGLPPEQREPIELGFFSGVTHEEIARQSGIPLGTIKTRIRAGLRKLRSLLDGVVTA